MHKKPGPTTLGTREGVQKPARGALTQSYRQLYVPCVLTSRLTLTEGPLTTITGSLNLGVIGHLEGQLSASCALDIEEMLWHIGSRGCSITADLLPESFLNRLSDSENGPYRDEPGTVQVHEYIALSNFKYHFESLFTVVPQHKGPSGRRAVTLGQRFFMDRMDFRMEPRAILESHGEKLNENEWSDLKATEWSTLLQVRP